MLADYHVHTFYSDDCETPMEAMAERAVALGVEEICFTEHVDYEVPDVAVFDYKAYFKGLDSTKRKYGDRLTIRAGIEFGVQKQTIGRYVQDFED